MSAVGKKPEDPLADILFEANRLANEGDMDRAVELLSSRATALPEHRERLEQAIARIEERRGIGEA